MGVSWLALVLGMVHRGPRGELRQEYVAVDAQGRLESSSFEEEALDAAVIGDEDQPAARQAGWLEAHVDSWLQGHPSSWLEAHGGSWLQRVAPRVDAAIVQAIAATVAAAPYLPYVAAGLGCLGLVLFLDAADGPALVAWLGVGLESMAWAALLLAILAVEPQLRARRVWQVVGAAALGASLGALQKRLEPLSRKAACVLVAGTALACAALAGVVAGVAARPEPMLLVTGLLFALAGAAKPLQLEALEHPLNPWEHGIIARGTPTVLSACTGLAPLLPALAFAQHPAEGGFQRLQVAGPALACGVLCGLAAALRLAQWRRKEAGFLDGALQDPLRLPADAAFGFGTPPVIAELDDKAQVIAAGLGATNRLMTLFVVPFLGLLVPPSAEPLGAAVAAWLAAQAAGGLAGLLLARAAADQQAPALMGVLAATLVRVWLLPAHFWKAPTLPNDALHEGGLFVFLALGACEEVVSLKLNAPGDTPRRKDALRRLGAGALGLGASYAVLHHGW